MILNGRGLSGFNLSSFANFQAVEATIDKGTYLYKFSDNDVFYWETEWDKTIRRQVTKENEKGERKEVASMFWANVSDLYEILHYAQDSGKPLQLCVQQRSAVLHNWNGLNSLLIVRLRYPVRALIGPIGPQTEKNYKNWKKRQGYTSPIELWGGASQVVVPNLKRNHLEVIIPAETVYSRDPVQHILDYLGGYPDIK